MGFRVSVLKGARWFLWLLVGWVLVRGIASFFAAPQPAPGRLADAATLAPAPAYEEAPGAFAALFAHEYLTFGPGQAAERAARLAPFLLSGRVDGQAGLAASAVDAVQTVHGTWPYRVTKLTDATWQVTVAARVTTQAPAAQAPAAQVPVPPDERFIYLSVPVMGGPAGFVVYDYPTVVPAPTTLRGQPPTPTGRVITDTDGQIRTLLTGFLKAYAAGSAGDVTYFTEPGAQVAGLAGAQVFGGLLEVTFRQEGETVWAEALVAMEDPVAKVSTRQRYTFEVVQRDSRWYVKQILQKGA